MPISKIVGRVFTDRKIPVPNFKLGAYIPNPGSEIFNSFTTTAQDGRFSLAGNVGDDLYLSPWRNINSPGDPQNLGPAELLKVGIPLFSLRLSGFFESRDQLECVITLPPTTVLQHEVTETSTSSPLGGATIGFGPDFQWQRTDVSIGKHKATALWQIIPVASDKSGKAVSHIFQDPRGLTMMASYQFTTPNVIGRALVDTKSTAGVKSLVLQYPI